MLKSFISRAHWGLTRGQTKNMWLTSKYFQLNLVSTLVFIFMISSFSLVTAEEGKNRQSHYCGKCGYDCTCGCAQTGVCNCAPKEKNEGRIGVCGGGERAEGENDAPIAFEEECEQDDDQSACYRMSSNAFENFNRLYLQTYEYCDSTGVWMPEDPPLFRPFVADPRQVTYSAGWRFNDQAMTKNIIDVSFGDSFAAYRWCGIGPWCGALQIELEGAVWAVFNPCEETAPLINADYYVGVPITYAFDKWQFRLRGYHISSHIGDEFLIINPGFDRRNASAEYVDFFISHDLTPEIRVYSGLGYIVAQDHEFKTKRFYAEAGVELRLPSMGFINFKDWLYGCPFYGMHVRTMGNFNHHIDMTYVLGYEFGKLCGLCRRARFFMEYHDGYSAEGQFCKIATNYLAFRMSYGF